MLRQSLGKDWSRIMLAIEKLRGGVAPRTVTHCLVALMLLTGCANKAPVEPQSADGSESSPAGVTLTLEKARNLQSSLPCKYPLKVAQDGDSVSISCLDADGVPDWAIYADLIDKDAGKKLICLTPIGRNLMGPNWTSYWTDDESLLLQLQKVLGGELIFAWQICDQEGQ